MPQQERGLRVCPVNVLEDQKQPIGARRVEQDADGGLEEMVTVAVTLVLAAGALTQVGRSDLGPPAGTCSGFRLRRALRRAVRDSNWSRAEKKCDRSLADGNRVWRLVNPKMPEQWTTSLGEGAEILADQYNVSREEQDEFALRSHQRAAAAWERGDYGGEVVDIPDVELERDEPIRPDSTLEKLGGLRPAFRKDGTVTAGNASPLNDGAAAVMLADKRGVEASGREPLARVVSRGVHGVDPPIYGIAPVEAANKALTRAGIGWGDLKAVELNEAFAAQSLACIGQWPDLDPEIVNVNGGAIALGHPIGCSGARILTTLSHELRRRGGGFGLATLCIGVGQGIAMVIEA